MQTTAPVFLSSLESFYPIKLYTEWYLVIYHEKKVSDIRLDSVQWDNV